MARRRSQPRFTDLEKQKLLEAIGTCRKACLAGHTHSLFDRKDVYAGCDSLLAAIDKLAETLTGDRQFFWGKLHSSASHFESKANIDNR